MKMKKITSVVSAIIISVVFSVSASARDIEQGTLEVGGDLDISISSTDVDTEGGSKTDTDTQSFDASVLYYFQKNVGLGVLWSYENAEATTGASSAEVTTILIGPQLSFNLSLNDKTNARLEGTVFYGSTEVNDSVSTVEADGFGWGIAGGLSYFVTESVSLNGGVTFISLTEEIDSTNADIDVDSLSFGVGISVYIN